jgi:lysophospholipase L1-like esterase
MKKLLLLIKRLKKRILTFLKDTTKPFTYVALGDSTAEGMGASKVERSYTHIIYASLKERYRSTKYYNFARSGAILADVVEKQLPKALEASADLITISVGANDIIRRTKSDEYERLLRKLLQTLQRQTDATVVISTVPDLSLTPSVPKLLRTYSRYMANKLNEIILRTAEDTNTVVVDIFNDSRALLKIFPEAVASDGWHPSDFGYAIWANSILVTLRNIIEPPKREKISQEEEENIQ